MRSRVELLQPVLEGVKNSDNQVLATMVLSLISASTVYGQGDDNLSAFGINEGAIGSGYNNYSTPDVDEGAWLSRIIQRRLRIECNSIGGGHIWGHYRK